ncbi:MAG: helix-turn-helix domain-containing protein [Bacteroides sp.]|nr:helix-turn-helix domain-containing protein [Roseburia sp.]MCM1347371.1 helix-turn-helix domain-containing protein [Bacteroides sp.]MCM1421848.1 helix-turn-helix domain-containing protein [Bacteroides sp.]
MSLRRFLSFILGVICCMLSYAQPFFSRHLTISDGISGNEVRDITQDKRGFIWMATDNGLCMFDGQYFYTLKKRPDGLTSNELNCVCADRSKDLLWIGTPRDGLVCFNYMSGSFHVFRHNPKDNNSLADNSITGISHAPGGKIWISTYWGGIDRYNSDTECFEHFCKKTIAGMPSDQVWTAAEYGDGNLYVGHVYDGLSIIDISHKTARHYPYGNRLGTLPSKNVYCSCSDRQGNLWLGTREGLVLMDSSRKRIVDYGKYHPKLSGTVHKIIEAGNGEIWVATEFSEVVTIKLNQPLFSPEKVLAEALPSQGTSSGSGNTMVRSLFKDSFGNVWIGRDGEGVDFYSHSQPLFRSYDRHTKTDSLKTICADGMEWFISNSKELYVKETGTYSERLVLSLPEIHDIAFDGKNRLFVASNRGVDIIDTKQKNVVNTLYFPVNFVWSIYQDRQSRLWAGTYGGGIYVCDTNGKIIKNYHTKDGFCSNIINDIRSDGKGNIWISTGEGLACIAENNLDSCIVYGIPEGLPSDYIFSAIADDRNNIWCGTKAGISCIGVGHDILNYSWGDGIPSDGFVHGSAARTLSGEMIFSTGKYYCAFSPDSIFAADKHPDSFITWLTLSANGKNRDTQEGQKLYTGDKGGIRLNYRQNSFSINYSTADCALNRNVEYSYRLKGLSDTWISDNGSGEAIFSYLPYGHYTFELKARMKGQQWKDSCQQLAIYIAPPLWLTWWAKLIYLLTALAIVVIVLHLWNKNTYLEGLIRSRKIDFHYKKIEPESDSCKDMSGNDKEFLRRINQIIEENYASETFDVKSLAAEMCMSPSNLYRKMKSATNLSTVEFIRKTRIRKAEEMMLSGKYTLTEIGEKVGYTTPESFRRAFKEEYGVTPSAYLKALNKIER